MDNRAARRAAEKAARELISSRAALVGDLAAAQAERNRLADDTAHAQTRGRQLVATAQAEAARLLQAAHDLERTGDQQYNDAYTAATTGGWTTADLTALGYQRAAGTATRRRRPTAIPKQQTHPNHGATAETHH